MEDSTHLPPGESSLVGQQLAQFRIDAKLGAGGMGVVYKATDVKLRRTVAVKVLAPNVALDPQGRARFLREARASASVTHPNIAAVYEVGEHEGRIYLALEYIEGRTLRARLAHGPMVVSEVVHVAREIASALGKAHDAGIVHRDLTPDNVMVTPDGHVKVLDFGLAKLRASGVPGALAAADASTASALVSQEGNLIGTPAYMSPEQVCGKPVDARTDIFSLGVVLYELLTGTRPFAGDTIVDVAIAISRDAPEPPSSLRPAVSRELEAVVIRCLEKRAEDRYPQCDALLDELDGMDTLTRTRGVATHDIDELEETGGASWRAPAVIAALSLLAGVVVIASALRRSGDAATTGDARSGSRSSTSAMTATRGIPVTDLKMPESSNAEALAEFRAGLQAIRDAAYEVAITHFLKAAALDPNLAAAHLRIALILESHGRTTEVREAFTKAVGLRSLLSDRDQALLDAFEPLLQRQPADHVEHERRMRAAAAAFPYDAELLMIYAMIKTLKPEDQLVLAERVIALDEKYADAWQIKARSLAFVGRNEEAMRALDRCLEVSPGSNDCLMERVSIFGARGECAKMEPDARRWIAKNPSSSEAYDRLAVVLAAIGRSREAVGEVLEQKWARLPDASREREKALDHGLLAFYAGDFVRAEADFQETLRLVASDPNDPVHAQPTVALAALYTETRRPALAGKVAESYLRRRDAWVESPTAVPMKDATPTLLMAEMNGGLRTRTDTRNAIAQWTDGWRTRAPDDVLGSIWAAGLGATAETPEDARAAIDALPALSSIAPSTRSPAIASRIGHVYLLAGRVKDAVPFLDRAKNDCEGLMHPYAYTRTLADLGAALEASSPPDTAGACAAYKLIVDRWPSPSVTADAARARYRALACK